MLCYASSLHLVCLALLHEHLGPSDKVTNRVAKTCQCHQDSFRSPWNLQCTLYCLMR